MVLFSFFVSELREHFAKSRLVLLPAMTDSCARDVLNDQAIFTALPKVRADPLIISFSLTLGELVPNTMQSISYHFFWMFEIAVLGDQPDVRMRRSEMNF